MKRAGGRGERKDGGDGIEQRQFLYRLIPKTGPEFFIGYTIIGGVLHV